MTDPSTGLPEIKAAAWIDGRVFALGTLGGRSSGGIAISNGRKRTPIPQVQRKRMPSYGNTGV
jgi:hypothetical protein